VSYYKQRLYSNTASFEKQFQEAISRAQGPDYIETVYSASQIRDYLADPILFGKDEWGWIPSPDQAGLLKTWADLDVLDLQVMAARGTGKSVTISLATVWSMVFLPTVFGSYSTRILAGSGDQAKRTYSYVRTFLTTGRRVSQLLAFHPKTIYAAMKNGATCQVYRLSRAQIHGEHPDQLLVDETCDAEREEGGELVSSAMQAISSSRHGRRALTSTPYYAFGVFAERWNNAKEIGVETFHWTAEVGKRSWMPIMKQQQEWDRATRDPTVNIAVEWMGQFGEAVGQIHNPQLVDDATVDYDRTRTVGTPCWISVDWGFVHPTVIGVWELRNATMMPLWMEASTQSGLEDLIQRIIELRQNYKAGWVFPDSAGVFQNQRLAQLGIPTIPVTFSLAKTGKEQLIGIVNRLLELHKLQIHSSFKTLIQQMKSYTRDPKTAKPLKVNDDWEDCLLCAAKALIVGIDSGVQVGFGPA